MRNGQYDLFDILYANFKTKEDSSTSSIQGKNRPCVVIQNDEGNYYSSTLIVMCLTSKFKKINQPTHGIIKKNPNNGLKRDSMILGEQIFTIDKSDVIDKWGKLDSQKDRDIACKCFLANLYGKKEVKVEVVM